MEYMQNSTKGEISRGIKTKTENLTQDKEILIPDDVFPFSTNGIPNTAHDPKGFIWISEPPFNETEWIICETVHLACMFVGLYILYALTRFYLGQPRRHNYSGKSSGSRWLEKMCIIAVVMAILRFINNQALLITGWKSKERCSTLLNISIALYFLALHPVYLFLWIRQRIFYSNRALKHLYNLLVRFLSLVTIFCFFIVTGVSMVLFVVDRKNSASGRVCGDHYVLESWGDMGVNGSSLNTTLHHIQGVKVNTIAGLLACGIQISFLVLFLYPIMDNKLRAVRNSKMRCHHSLMKLIRRAFILSGVCIFTDVAIALGVKAVHSQYPKAIFAPLAMYDINLIINIICIVATFRRWRRMLLPCAYRCFGKDIISRCSTIHNLDRQSRSQGQDSTNGVNKSLSNGGLEYPPENSICKAPKAPIVDVVLDSDREESENGGNEEQNENMRNEEARKTREERKDNNGNNNKFPPIQYYFENSRKKDALKRHHTENRSRRYTSCSELTSKPLDVTSSSPFFSTTRFSLRSKKTNNVIATKFVVKTEAYIWAKETLDEEL